MKNGLRIMLHFLDDSIKWMVGGQKTYLDLILERFAMKRFLTLLQRIHLTCLHCQSTHVQRRIGRIRIARSEDSHLEDLADPAKLEGLEDDPQSLGRVMRQMSRELGEDMGPEFDEVVTRLESGQSPDEIEESMPELGSDAGGPFGADDI